MKRFFAIFTLAIVGLAWAAEEADARCRGRLRGRLLGGLGGLGGRLLGGGHVFAGRCCN